ncbi:MAG: ATP-binding protein [Thermoplasmata archaeon]
MSDNIEDKMKNRLLEGYVKRDLEDRIWRYIDSPEIISVTGPRQSGKTTLLLKIHDELDNSRFISFEDREVLDLFEEDIKNFAKVYIEDHDYLIIDEFQYAESGGKKLKYLYDHYPDKKILITGSSVSEMTVKGLKFLTGRIFNFILYPFSFEEFLRYRDEKLYDIYNEKKKMLEGWICSKKEFDISKSINSKFEELRKEYTIYGGYPRVVISEDEEEKRTVIKNIINTYLLREIRDVLDISDDREVRNLMRLLSLQTGELTNYSNISNKSGFTHMDLKKKLNILELTFIIKLVQPFFTNKQKEIVKTPKVYFYDNGFRNGVISNFQEMENRSDRGELNENFFFSQVVRKVENLKYWRSKGKAEVDFVLQDENVYPYEIKTTPKVTRSLRSFSDRYDPEYCFVVNEMEFGRRSENIFYVPLWLSGPLCEVFLN